jgi:hypothetical protein
MSGLMSGIENSINTNINDIISHANSVVMTDIYELNEEFYEGYQWIAALDSATCLVCAALDGKIFDRLPGGPTPPFTMKEYTEAPEQPLHPGYRCIIVPVLEGMRDDPSQTQLNYKDWFDGRDEATKLDILGPSRYAEYKNGKAVTAFVKDNKILTLEALQIDRVTRKELLRSSQFDEIEYKEVPNNDGGIRGELTAELAKRGIPADFDESAKETIDYIVKLHDEVARDFPDIKDVIKEISYTANKDVLNNNEAAGYDIDTMIMKYNKSIFNSKENLLNYINLNKQWFISDSIKGQIAHEYGHAIEKLLIRKYNDDNIAQNIVQKILIDNGIKTWSDVEKQISYYAEDRRTENFHEVIAEIVSDHFTSKEPRNISEIIYNRLIKLYEGVL